MLTNSKANMRLQSTWSRWMRQSRASLPRGNLELQAVPLVEQLLFKYRKLCWEPNVTDSIRIKNAKDALRKNFSAASSCRCFVLFGNHYHLQWSIFSAEGGVRRGMEKGHPLPHLLSSQKNKNLIIPSSRASELDLIFHFKKNIWCL